MPPDINESCSLFSDNIKFVKLAIKNGGDVNERCDNKEKPYYGYTPLEWHMIRPDFHISCELLDAGAKITSKVNWESIFKWGSYATLLRFLNHGLADIIDINKMLEYSLQNSGADHTRVLIKFGADPNKVLSNGNTPL